MQLLKGGTAAFFIKFRIQCILIDEERGPDHNYIRGEYARWQKHRGMAKSEVGCSNSLRVNLFGVKNSWKRKGLMSRGGGLGKVT